MSALPPLYDRWMSEALGEPVPGERRSTCDACPLCTGDDAMPAPRFHPAVRCCGHTPAQPNFVLGGILVEGGVGADRLRARIDTRVGLTPLGLYPSPTRADELSSKPFGSDPTLACPYLVGERCAVWAHREAVCSTWYCRLDRGALGQRMQDEVQALLEAVERSLTRHLARSLGALPEGWGPSAWGPYQGREEAYFEACHAAASELSWSDVRRVGGLEIATRLRGLRPLLTVHQAPRLPSGALHAGGRARTSLPNGRVIVHTWSKWDPVVLTAEEVGAVDAAEGRTCGEVLADGVLTRERLQELVDHGVLG